MKKGFVTAYSVIAFAVLAVAIAWFCISVFSEASRGAEEAERTFSWLCRETAQNSYSLGFMSDAYIEKTTSLCQGVSSLVAITISSPTETFYAWPAASPALTNTSEKGPEIQRTSLFSKIMDAGVDMGANATPAIRITASLRTLSSATIFAASRNSFILVFLVLLSSIIVLLAAPGQAQKSMTSKKEEESEKGTSAFDAESGAFRQNSGLSAFSTEKESKDYSFDSSFKDKSESTAEHEDHFADYAPKDALNDEPYTEEKLDEPIEEPLADVEAKEPDAPPSAYEPEEGALRQDFAQENAESADESYVESADTDVYQRMGRFSQDSGFSREQYLEEKLNEELIRAASADRDVSILILRIFGIERASDEFAGIAKILINMFTYRDLVFEFGEDAEACILPSASLDETMQAAEHLYGLLRDYLAEQGLSSRICIGISTRMTRAVPASRMIREADTAARKAEEEERLPIVAFRANPEKYRDYMAKSQS